MIRVESPIFSPGSEPNTQRISATFHIPEKAPLVIFFEYPISHSDWVTQSGDPWLVLALPVAFLLRQDLTMESPVDQKLLANARSILRIWRSWHSNYREIVIATEIRNALNVCLEHSETLIFFTGGIDSFFSLISEIENQDRTNTISKPTLVTGWGLDIPLSEPDGFKIAWKTVTEAANKFGVGRLWVKTNLRELPGYQFGDEWYGKLTHGAALSSIAHLFGTNVSRAIIGSTYDFAHLVPWGSHPLVDPLFSASGLAVIHDGAGFTRVEKTAAVMRSALATANLRVCWGPKGNCSRCSKCLRTMATIDLYGH